MKPPPLPEPPPRRSSVSSHDVNLMLDRIVRECTAPGVIAMLGKCLVECADRCHGKTAALRLCVSDLERALAKVRAIYTNAMIDRRDEGVDVGDGGLWKKND